MCTERHDAYRVNREDIGAILFLFLFDPVPVEVCEKSVEVCGPGEVFLPFLDVISEESVALQATRSLYAYAFQKPEISASHISLQDHESLTSRTAPARATRKRSRWP